MVQSSGLLKTTMAIAILSLYACSKSGGSGYTAPPAVLPNVKLATDARFGSVLTDSLGKVLYFYTLDAGVSSSCTGGCAVAWPIFYQGNLKLGDGLDSADFKVVTRPDGSFQTTYKGWPLYYYVGDTKPGDILGDASGSIWFVAKPDYSVMLLNNVLIGNNGVQYTGAYQPGQQTVQYITDAYGRTLYAFSPDRFKKNTYTKADFSNNTTWPIQEISNIKYVPSTLDKTSFDTTAVYGKIQLTYKGWPLYHFGPDNQVKGNTKGVSVPTPGVWPVVNQNSGVAPQ